MLAAGLKKLGFAPEQRRVLRHAHGEGRRQAATASSPPRRPRRSTCASATARIGIALDETTTPETVEAIWRAFGGKLGYADVEHGVSDALPASLKRSSAFLTHPVFHSHRSETELLRYMRKLSDRDLALDRAMIPLGSCTMKLNATTEMMPLTWPAFGSLHPFAPREQADGYHAMFDTLEKWLCDITGYDAVSLQPNSGAQGEYAGLLAIRGYHTARGDSHRNICLIPSSAHGTNPASASMVGMDVVVVACDKRGNVDVDDLRAKAEKHAANLAAIMITYPSTHGVFEEHIREICEIVHATWRSGLSRRRQHERAGRPVAARRLRRRRQPSQPAQDVLHSAWRRRTGHGPDRRQGASRAVSARPSRGRMAMRRSARCRPRPMARRRS